MKPVIDIENLSKKFRIGHAREPYLSIRDGIKNIFKPAPKEDFYALRDINFQVKEGDAVGIIGKNGAGKSTLLKIISKITPPTTGSITYRGRVASLLEVGTGFHAELTGRENIFMNGSILGMKRAEIKKNFDAIVDFSGVAKFIDTPLKHYSSGMQLRLAFAVAAFLENEILIIDEVLAVGDTEFQKKCLGKMGEISKSGRTLLFVSHNMAAILALCQKGMVLSSGQLVQEGNIAESVDFYNQTIASAYTETEVTYQTDKVRVLDYQVASKGRKLEASASILLGHTLDITLELLIREQLADLSIAMDVFNSNDEFICHISNEDDAFYFTGIAAGTVKKISISTDPILLNPGDYYINLWIGEHHTIGHCQVKNLVSFTVEQGGVTKRIRPLPPLTRVFILTQWKTINDAEDEAH